MVTDDNERKEDVTGLIHRIFNDAVSIAQII
jgi:hypothetical protein